MGGYPRRDSRRARRGLNAPSGRVVAAGLAGRLPVALAGLCGGSRGAAWNVFGAVFIVPACTLH